MSVEFKLRSPFHSWWRRYVFSFCPSVFSCAFLLFRFHHTSYKVFLKFENLFIIGSNICPATTLSGISVTSFGLLSIALQGIASSLILGSFTYFFFFLILLAVLMQCLLISRNEFFMLFYLFISRNAIIVFFFKCFSVHCFSTYDCTKHY